MTNLFVLFLLGSTGCWAAGQFFGDVVQGKKQMGSFSYTWFMDLLDHALTGQIAKWWPRHGLIPVVDSYPSNPSNSCWFTICLCSCSFLKANVSTCDLGVATRNPFDDQFAPAFHRSRLTTRVFCLTSCRAPACDCRRGPGTPQQKGRRVSSTLKLTGCCLLLMFWFDRPH